jgi:RNA polymerase sigma-70 factor (ECF subfamily)
LRSISIEGQSAREVAARLQVSVRTVENDLKLALGHCADSLNHIARRSGRSRPRS